MIRTRKKGRLLLFLVFFIVLLFGGPAAAEGEAPQAPSAALTAKSFTYTGEVQYVSLDSVSHPLASEGHFSFQWYKNGELLDVASQRLPIRTVSDSGLYYCKVIFTHNGKTSEICTDAVEIRMEKRAVEIPEIPPFSYTGYRQYPAVYATADYRVEENEGGIEAGAYSVVLSLTDVENTSFLPSSYAEPFDGGARVRVSYTVARAENAFSTPFSVTSVFEGNVPAVRAFSKFGEVKYRFFKDAEGRDAIALPTACGTYYVQAYVEESADYTALYSAVLPFEIRPLTVTALRILSMPARLSYTAFESVSLEGLSLVATVSDGSTHSVPLSAVSVTYPIGGGSLFAKDTYVLLHYGGVSVPLPVTVRRAALDFSSVAWSASGWVYDGTEREITVSSLPAGVFVSTYEGNRITDAGTHTVYAMLSYDRDNYEGPTALSHTLSVSRQEVPLPVLAPAVYNGTLQSAPIASTPLYAPVTAVRGVHAGSYAVQLRLCDAKNYVFEGGGEAVTLIFEILPLSLVAEIEDVTLLLGEKFSPPAYRIVAGAPIGEDDLGFRASFEGGKAVYIFENPDYRVRFSGGAVHRTYRLPPAAEAALFLGLTVVLLFGMIVFFLILSYRKRSRAAAASQSGSHACTYPMFSAEKRVSLSTEDKEYLICEQEPPPAPEALSLSSIPDADATGTEAESGEASEASVEAVDVSTADALITDALAEALVMTEEREIYTEGTRHGVINVDTLSAAFLAGETVDINRLKKKKLLASDVGYLKVLARGSIDKPLTVYADDFSLGAIKMIALTGGRTFHVRTRRRS